MPQTQEKNLCPVCQAHIQWLTKLLTYGCPRCGWTIKRRMSLVKMTMHPKA